MKRASLALALLAAIPLALAATHCDREEESVPLDSQFGDGTSRPRPGRDGGAVGGSSGNDAGSSSGGGASSGGAEEYPNDDPDFDPLADGGYWDSRYDAGADGYLADGGLNGGPGVWNKYGQCPIVKPSRFSLDGQTDEAAVYGADFSPTLDGTVSRINLLVAESLPFSYLGPFFPLGFLDPPLLPSELPKVSTFPFPGCKRCVFIGTGAEETQFIAIGGMLIMAPAPNPKNGSINARIDLAVLVEAKRSSSGWYVPTLPLKCIRVRSAPIVAR